MELWKMQKANELLEDVTRLKQAREALDRIDAGTSVDSYISISMLTQTERHDALNLVKDYTAALLDSKQNQFDAL